MSINIDIDVKTLDKIAREDFDRIVSGKMLNIKK